MKYFFGRLYLFFFGKKEKVCKHGFLQSEVMDLKIDPKCKLCGKPVSELMPK